MTRQVPGTRQVPPPPPTIEREVTVPLNVRVRVSLSDRMRTFVEANRSSIRGVVEAALEEYMDARE